MKIGFAMGGSFCTFSKVFPILELLCRDYQVTPIFSECVYTTDTRFGTAAEHIENSRELCGTAPLHTIAQVEPIGPKKLFDILVNAPCTGNPLQNDNSCSSHGCDKIAHHVDIVIQF